MIGYCKRSLSDFNWKLTEGQKYRVELHNTGDDLDTFYYVNDDNNNKIPFSKDGIKSYIDILPEFKFGR